MNLKNPEVAQNKHKIKRDRCLFWLGIVAVISGVLDPFSNSDILLLGAIQFIAFSAAIALLYCWIIYDGRMRGFAIPKYIKYLLLHIGNCG